MHSIRSTPVLIGAGLALIAMSATAQFSSPMRNVENPDRFPYVESGSVTISPPFVNGFINFPTPPGRRYIIEQASMTCTTPSNGDVFTQALLNVAKAGATSSIIGIASPVVALAKRGTSAFGSVIWSDSANIRLISEANTLNPDGGGAVFFNIFHTDFTVSVTCSATLFGHSLAL